MKQKKRPMRMCIGCREMKPKRELIRIVIPKEGQMALDASGKQNGRGAYICPDEKCLASAQRNRSLRLNTEIVQAVQNEISKRIHAKG